MTTQTKHTRKFITRACDSHYDMLELLKLILLRMDMEPKSAVFPCSAMREDIKIAIAKAEGVQP